MYLIIYVYVYRYNIGYLRLVVTKKWRLIFNIIP